jgi:hypothetical protein
MTKRALVDVVAAWLPHLGAPASEAPWVAEQVAEQMTGLPTPLRLGVGGLQSVLSALPQGTAVKLANAPGTGEYVRLVRSLATVVYLAKQEGDR